MHGEYIDLEPPRAQVAAGRLALTDELELIEVEDDVLGVVQGLKRIDTGLKLSYHKGQGVFVLKWVGLNEHGHLVEEFVGAYTELDGRLIHLIERLAARENRNRYDLATELDKLDAARDAENEREYLEKVGPAVEELAFALRRDLGVNNRAFMHSPKKRRRKR